MSSHNQHLAPIPERPGEISGLEFQVDNAASSHTFSDGIVPELRIGIALGEVVIADGTVTGAGVVLAQRLEQLAASAGTCISAAIREALPARLPFVYEDLGEQALKGFERPQRAYVVGMPRVREVTENQASPPLPRSEVRRASIAVLPFANLSNDPEQEYFADGMADDIITSLSKFKELLVIARNTTFTYKGQALAVATAAEQLNVGYILEGSISEPGKRIRVTAQLVEADSASHIWAERYDRELEDIFDVQDDITEQIVRAIAPEVQLAEQLRLGRRPPENLDAWGQYQLGISAFRLTAERFARSEMHFREAIGADPSFAAAQAWLALTLLYEAVMVFLEERATKLDEAYAHANEAVRLDGGDALARVALGRILCAMGDVEGAEREAARAVELNPNLWWAHHGLGSVYLFAKRDARAAIPPLQTASRLNPRDPRRYGTDLLLSIAHRVLGEYPEAIRFGRIACQVGEQAYTTHLNLAAALALAGEIEQAQEALALALEREPALSTSRVERTYGFGPPGLLPGGLLEGLRIAGLADQ